VLATGGTAGAVADMLVRAGAASVHFSFLMEIVALGGRDALAEHGVTAAVAI
jgi:adenine phosphoribosyltransferase